MISQGSLAGSGWQRYGSLLKELRAAGVKAIPSCTTLKGECGHSYQSWFDRGLWIKMAEALAVLAGERVDNARVGIDLEPYFPKAGEAPGPRYPKRGEPGGDSGEDEYRLAETMAPFIGTIKHEGITPWILPGGMEYAATWHLAMACPDAVLLDETTYNCPLDPAYWVHYERRKPAIESLRRGYLPGFYAVALRSPAFQDELLRRKISDFWVFFRPEDNAERFWTPEWMSGPSTQPATSR